MRRSRRSVGLIGLLTRHSGPSSPLVAVSVLPAVFPSVYFGLPSGFLWKGASKSVRAVEPGRRAAPALLAAQFLDTHRKQKIE